MHRNPKIIDLYLYIFPDNDPSVLLKHVRDVVLRDAVLQTYIPCLHLSFGEIIGEGKFLVSLRDIFFYTSFTYIFFPHKEPLFFAFNFVYLKAPLPQWADLISVARRMSDKYILEMYVDICVFLPARSFWYGVLGQVHPRRK